MSDERPPFYHPPPPGYAEQQWDIELVVRWLSDALDTARDRPAPADVVAQIEAALAAAKIWEQQDGVNPS